MRRQNDRAKNRAPSRNQARDNLYTIKDKQQQTKSYEKCKKDTRVVHFNLGELSRKGVLSYDVKIKSKKSTPVLTRFLLLHLGIQTGGVLHAVGGGAAGDGLQVIRCEDGHHKLCENQIGGL